MTNSSGGGNKSGLIQDQERWQRFLDALDEKLQLGLLTYLRKVVSYEFSDATLTITAASADDEEYLSRDPVNQHLVLLAQDAIGIEKIVVRS